MLLAPLIASAQPAQPRADAAVQAHIVQPKPAAPQIEDQVLAEINYARTRPREYAAKLRTWRTYFSGKVARWPGNPRGLATAEGVVAVDEAIAFLEKQEPLEPFSPSQLLALAAGDHVAEQGPRGGTGHASADGSDAAKRVERRGGGPAVGEVITYGTPTADEVVRNLIIDDNVPDRSHRKILYMGDLRFAGIRCGPHLSFGKMCVVNFGWTPDGQ